MWETAGAPAAVVRGMADEAGGPARFVEFLEGIHCRHNIAYTVNAIPADWLANQARAAATSGREQFYAVPTDS